jgi:hypothetical protein
MYLTIIFVTRVLRWLVGAGAATFAAFDFERFEGGLPHLESAPQEAAFASTVLVELVAAYVVARGVTEILALIAEDLAWRLHRG